jgi:RNA polymerase sigma factor (sigma-70 family)
MADAIGELAMTELQALEAYSRRRDAQAFRVLVEEYQRLVYAAASRRLAHSHDVEEVVQLTFLKLAKGAGTIRRDLGAWLYTTAINAANDLIRRDQTRRRHETAAAKPASASDDAEAAEWRALSPVIDEAMLELAEGERSVLVEHFFRGRSQRDLAGELGVSQPTVMRRIDAAVEALRGRLQSRGVGTGALVLGTTLRQFPAPPVPQPISFELAKIGMAGGGGGSAVAAPVAAVSVGAKAVVVAGTLMVLGAAGAVLLSSRKVASPLVAPATAPSGRATPVFDENAALAELAKVYALANDQNLRKIVPPFPEQRARYIDVAYPRSGGSDRVHVLGFSWTGDQLRSSLMGYEDPAFPSFADDILKVEWFHLDHPERVPWQPVAADWVVRSGLTIDDRLAAVAQLISAEGQTPIHFAHKIVRRPCIVLTGKVRKGVTTPEGFTGVTISRRALSPEEARRWMMGSPPENVTVAGMQFQTVAEILDAPFFDSRYAMYVNNYYPVGPDAHLVHTDPDYRASLQQVIDNIKAQVGGDWTIDDRDIDIWEPVEGPAAKVDSTDWRAGFDSAYALGTKENLKFILPAVLRSVRLCIPDGGSALVGGPQIAL